MEKPRSNIILFVVLVAAVLFMAGLNQYSQKLNPVSEEDAEKQQQAEAEQKQRDQMASKAPKMAAVPQRVPTGGAAPISDLETLGSDKTLGAASSSAPEVTVRWSWTPEVQSSQDKVTTAISKLQEALPKARIHVVNTDESPGTPDGVFVGDREIAPAAADGSISVNPDVVKSALGK